MKTQIITLGVLLVALNFTSCKNNEAPAPDTTANAVAPTQVDSTKQTSVTPKDTVKAAEKGEKEADEKNEKE
jgi:PBP1b-binding outer membrane lipoprotein LpoB